MLNISLSEFQDIINKNWETIIHNIQHNPVISVDDEWNDPIYDEYSQDDITEHKT